jgi:hypothetical protein
MLWQPTWRGLVRRLLGSPRPAPIQKNRRSRPLLEALEERWVPSNWFVSTLGSDSNPGSPTASFATIQHAVDVAQSGDRIHVAQGVYGYTGADQIADDARFTGSGMSGSLSGNFLHVSPAVVLVFDKALQIYGGFDTAFTTWAPSTYRTYIDGGTAVRGVYVLDDNAALGPGFGSAALDLEGFTVQACKATGEAGLTGTDSVNAFGAGMWVNTVARGTATQGAFQLKNMVFRGNYTQGNDATDIGGSAAGAAVALRAVGHLILDGVTFDTNLSQGGNATPALGKVITGGSAQGGAIFLDRSTVTTDSGATLTFYNNRAQAGSIGTAADALGGGLAMINSTAALRNVIALNNQVAGGRNLYAGGNAYGGTFYAASSTLNLVNVDIRRGGTAASRSGSKLLSIGPSGGGGIAALNSNVSLNQVQVISTSSAHGGVWITRTKSSATLSAQITNTVVADTTVNEPDVLGAIGISLNGVDATISHTTVANNRGGYVFLDVGILLHAGTNADGSARGATAMIGDSIIANNNLGLDVAGSPNVVTLNHVLYAGNSKDDNSDGQPDAAGTFNGLDTVIRAASAGFTSPGGPNYDYSLAASSPAVNQAIGSKVTVDINNNPRTGTPDLGAYEAPAPPRARSSVGLFDPETGIWQLRQSNAGGFFPDGPVFAYGSGGGHSKPVVGDWNGDGATTVGVVEVKAFDFNGKPFLTDASGNAIPVSVFELRNTNGPGTPDIIVPYGSFNATPVAGNWDNNPQHIDHIGVVENIGVLTWKLRNSFTRGAPDITIAYDAVTSTSIPVVGDWNGDGASSLGAVMNFPFVLTWALRNSFTPGSPDAGIFAYGPASAAPITGDWNNDGAFTPGIYDSTSGLWQLRNENSGGAPDAGAFTFGPSAGSNFYAEHWIPLAGDFDGLG